MNTWVVVVAAGWTETIIEDVLTTRCEALEVNPIESLKYL